MLSNVAGSIYVHVEKKITTYNKEDNNITIHNHSLTSFFGKWKKCRALLLEMVGVYKNY